MQKLCKDCWLKWWIILDVLQEKYVNESKYSVNKAAFKRYVVIDSLLLLYHILYLFNSNKLNEIQIKSNLKWTLISNWVTCAVKKWTLAPFLNIYWRKGKFCFNWNRHKPTVYALYNYQRHGLSYIIVNLLLHYLVQSHLAIRPKSINWRSTTCLVRRTRIGRISTCNISINHVMS